MIRQRQKSGKQVTNGTLVNIFTLLYNNYISKSMRTGNTAPDNEKKTAGIFPLHPDVVQHSFIDLFSLSSERMLSLVTDARAQGPEDEVYVFLINQHLENWHIKEKDFTDNDRAKTHYKVGLLYGVDMAQQLFRLQRVGVDLRADNKSAIRQSIQYLFESYRGLPDSTQIPGWIRQKQRELYYTGSDLLTVANASLNDRIRGMLGDGSDPNDAQAVQVGLVDGMIFVGAYENFTTGQQPNIFEQPTEYIPVLNTYRHRIDDNDPLSFIATFEFEETDSLAELVKSVVEQQSPVTQEHWMGGTLSGRKILVQAGPNKFTTAVEVDEIEIRRSPTFKRLGVYALGGTVATNIDALIWTKGYTFSNLAIGAFTVTLLEGARQLELKARERFYRSNFTASIVKPKKKQDDSSIQINTVE
jgi:hypothetical protein